ncbi:hypothetical protein OJF2_47790 [Aquisphaera giovannonii]|uniref:Sulfur globule protein n=1 Tax=Aquisphaera giovannonii TaxID=406548 RepID=A0A5B9W7V7_9BACT|nr:hypothetical protein [Aquisphaera giovannonii]QEH36219.1 hypothetical protein OJF2_47790 [Aquisphaera giovannonii]
MSKSMRFRSRVAASFIAAGLVLMIGGTRAGAAAPGQHGSRGGGHAGAGPRMNAAHGHGPNVRYGGGHGYGHGYWRGRGWYGGWYRPYVYPVRHPYPYYPPYPYPYPTTNWYPWVPGY